MIAVIFEVIIKNKKQEEYFEIAENLKPKLSKIRGFISIERFQSISNSEKIVSLSFWKDEESVKEWRNLETHRVAQQKGRNSVFDNYRLRIAGVIRDYGMTDREQAPDDSKTIHK